jgi:hypothetical protein
MPFVGEAHGDAVIDERPQLLDQPVFELPGPLALKKRDDPGASVDELVAVAPAAVGRIRLRDRFRIAPVPRILRPANLLRGRLAVNGGSGGRVTTLPAAA